MLLLSETLPMLQKRKQWARHIWSAGNVLHAECLIFNSVESPLRMFPFLLYIREFQAEQSFRTLSPPGWVWGGSSRVPSSDYQLRLDPEWLFLGPTGQKEKGSHFIKLSRKWLTCFLWSFLPCGRTVKSQEWGMHSIIFNITKVNRNRNSAVRSNPGFLEG